MRIFYAAVLATCSFLGCSSEHATQYNPLEASCLGKPCFLDAPVAITARVDPVYPKSAIETGRTGVVFVRLRVDSTGKVYESELQASESDDFSASAVSAARNLTFSIPMSAGHFVPIDMYLMAKFDHGPGASIDAQYKAVFSDQVILNFGTIPISEPIPEHKANPGYPPTALAQKLEGVVYIKMWVGPTGEPRDPSVIKSANQIFDSSALAAARLWRFKPAMYEGRPIGTVIAIPFRFAVR